MPQRVPCNPWLTYLQRFTAPCEHAAQCLVAQRLCSASTVSAYQEQVHAAGVGRPLVTDVVVDGRKYLWLQQIDNALGPRFGARTFRMVPACSHVRSDKVLWD
jgi:hypothetical protein